VRDQRLDAQALRLIAADQDAVGAIVGDDAHRRAATLGRALAGDQRIEYAHGVGRGGALQRDHVEVGIAALVDPADDAQQAIHVVGAIGQDQHVGAGDRGEVGVLRHQRPQHRHQLRGVGVLQQHDLRHHLVGGAADAVGQVVARQLAHVLVEQHLDHVAGRHGREAVHLQDRQERLVELVRRHRRRGQHRHLRLDARVDDEVLARGRAHRLDDLGDVGVLEVGRDARAAVLLGGSRLQAQQRREGAGGDAGPGGPGAAWGAGGRWVQARGPSGPWAGGRQVM
jgi:hypothetical protein